MTLVYEAVKTSSQNPYTQTWDCEVKLNLPSTLILHDDIVTLLQNIPLEYPEYFYPILVANGFNIGSANQESWDLFLTAYFTEYAFAKSGLTVFNPQIVTGSQWIDDGGNAALKFRLIVQSDPLSQSDMVIVITAFAVVLIALVLAIIGSLPGVIVGILLTALAAIGVISVASVFVTLVSQILPAPGTWTSNILWIGVAVALAGTGIYFVTRSFKK